MRVNFLFISIFGILACLLSHSTVEAQSTRDMKNVELGIRLKDYVSTDDPRVNAIMDSIFQRSVFGKLFPPLPPSLPNNWFSPGGVYVGQWVWDTMFQLIAFAPLNQDAVIRNVFENYWNAIDNNPEAPKGSYRYGIIPNFINPQNWPPLGYSQIPILGWGCWLVYRQTNDIELIKRAFPYLVSFDHWYSTERDIENDGLIEFGAYKPVGKSDMLQTARFETFDFHPAMDEMKLTIHPGHESGEWYGNVEGVEQTCFLILQEQALVKMALLLDQKEMAKKFQDLADKRIRAVRTKMWDSKTKFFYSLDRDSDQKIYTKTLQAFLALTCGAATKSQADGLLKHLENPQEFWSNYPVPTVALDDPKYNTRIGRMPPLMWRGDVWPGTNYLISLGLQKYGFHKTANELTLKMLDMINLSGINERYHPVSGLGLGVKDLGMSCSVWSMVVQNIYGLQDDFCTIVVPEDPAGKSLMLGKLRYSFPSSHSLELQSSFDREMKIVLNEIGKLTTKMTCNGQEITGYSFDKKNNMLKFKALAGKKYEIDWR